MIQKRICVGVILKPVGIKGQVKIKPYTTSLETILKFPKLFLENNDEIVLLSPKLNEKDFVISFIKGYSDRTSVEKLHLKKLYVNREDLKELDHDEYYFEDLKELMVLNQNRLPIGKVIEAFDYGAGVFLELNVNGKISTLPFNKNSVLEVDLNKKTIQIDSSFILS